MKENIRTFTSPVSLTENMWYNFSEKQRVELLKSRGYKGETLEFAKFKRIQTVANRGGGMIARDLLNLNREYLKRNGGSVAIRGWKVAK